MAESKRYPCLNCVPGSGYHYHYEKEPKVSKRKKEPELSPAAIIAGMDAEMGAKQPTFSEFQRGALWAFKLFQGQLQKRVGVLKNMAYGYSPDGLSPDESGMVNATANLYVGLEVKFESELLKQMSTAEKDFNP